MQSPIHSTHVNAVKTAGAFRAVGPLVTTVVVFLLLLTSPVFGQITGTVYRDFNADGVRSFTTATPAVGEIGVGGVTVTVFSGTTSVGSDITDAQGFYSIAPTSGTSWRVQFTNLPTGYFEGPHGVGSGTSVQFVASANTANVNLGINYPADYCQPNPDITVPCYVNGNPTSTTGNAGVQPVLLSLPYNSVGVNPSETVLSRNNQVGTVYGVAYQRATQLTFTSALVKRHSGLGFTENPGTIYLSKPVSATAYTNTSFVTIPNAGAVMSNTGRGLTGTTTDLNRDPSTFDQVGKVGLGDLEISEDGSKLYVVNLNDRKLYQVGITNFTTTSPTAGAITAYTIPTPALGQATGSVFRPFGLKYYRGKLYVGGVTTNEAVPTTKTVNFGNGSTTTPDLITRDTVGMKAVVFEFDPVEGTFNTTPVLSFPLTYKKGADNNDKTGVDRADHWLPWTDIQPGFGTNPIPSRFARNDLPQVSYPQAILAGIEFDVNGNMIISLRDRFADQYGNNNYGPNVGSGIQQYRAIGPGDILQAGKCNPAVNQWTIESGAKTCTTGPTAGVNNGEGFGNGEYYFSDAIAAGNPYHNEMSEGGLAVLPGTDEVASIALDPVQQTDAGGIRRFRISTGASSPATGVQIYYSGSDVSTYGKANGLGDLELACDPAPIEIGNRLFNDGPATTADGIQSFGAGGFSGVTVQLYKNNLLVGQTTTDANGEYYFNDNNVTGGLLPLMAYEIRVPLNQTALAGYVTTQLNVGTDDAIDSDGITVGGNAVIALTTGNYGQNNHTYDIGFSSCATITNPSAAQSVCSGTPVSSLSVATTSTGTNSIRFVYFTTPQSGTAMYTGGTTIGTVTPANGVASITSTVPVSNTTNAPVTYYVYAVLNPTPIVSACLPSQLIQVTIRPVPVATATGDEITCIDPATVTGASSVTGSAFSWTRVGGGLTSTAASFTTNTPGSYVLTVTANGCTSTNSATAVVTLNNTPPANVAAINNGPLTCAQTSVVLTASSSTTGVSYRWLAPLTATTPNTSVSAPGTYSVVITSANGCTAIATTTVTSNTVAPTATINSLTLTCTNPTGTLTATPTGGTTPYAYRWNTNATTQQINVTTAGPYSVTVTGANGCSTTATTTVISNTAVPTATINSLTLSCTNPTGTLTATPTGGTTPYAYRWSTNATTQQINVTTAGPYSVTVTGANGCSTTATTTVASDMAVPTATINSLTLSCTNPTGTLTANVTGGTTPYAYRWNTTATTQQITVTTAGPYSVTVTGANGCSIVAATSVASDTALPTATINSLTLSCANPSGTLTATPTGGTMPYTYRWNTNATTAQITVSTGGPYSVTVTGANGCSTVATTTVISNTAVPTATINSLTLSCANPSGTLTATPTGGTTPYAYRWSTNATSPAITVSTSGPYSVTVTGANGCSTVAATSVASDTAVPTATINSLTLSCTNPSGTLTATPTGGTTPYAYRWSTNATSPAITVSTSGPYSVTVTGANGCSTVAATSVASDTAVPTATINSLTLSCANPSGTLTATPSGGVTPYTYRWSTNATTQQITVGSPGSYSVVVTGANGCQASAITTVLSDVGQPTVNISSLTLTCTNPSGTLTANVSGGVAPFTYRWSTNATTPAITVGSPGNYTVVVTGNNGCVGVATTNVTSDTASPVATINSFTLSCTNPTGMLTASVTGGTAPFTYRWNTTATTATIPVSTAGPYSVTVTGANGCSTVATTTVTSDTAVPTATINSLTLSCTNPSGTLTASVTGGTTPYAYRWSTNATTQQINVTTAGPYSVTVTGANGCSTTATTTVASDMAVPTATINSLTLSCTNPTGTLTANVTGGTTPYAYRWNTTATTQQITVTTAGPYSVTVTGANGCSTVAATSVASDTALPTATINSLTLSCANPSGTLTATPTGGTTPYIYRWNTNATTAQITVSTGGPYSVTVTGANGCNTSATTIVASDTAVPTVTVNSLTLSCTNPTGTLTASVTGGVAPFTYRWNTNATTTQIIVSTGGPYSVTVTGANGCSTIATTTVISNTAVPIATINSLTLSCTNPTGILSASVTGGVAPFAYRWNTTATTATIPVSTAGPYSVTVTGANGCSTVAATTVTSDTAVPTATINSLTLSCANPSGTLTASVTGGTTPYAYRWSTNATSPQITVSTAGPYSVTVTGANGCSTVTTTSVTSDTAVPTVTVNSLTLSCAVQTGTLSASVTGGMVPYTYRWNTGATTPTLSVSAAGPYSVAVTGNNGCTGIALTNVVSDTAVPTVSVNSLTLTCANPTGVLTATVPGNAASYTYRWNTNATSSTISVSTAGPYSVTVTGTNGCSTSATTTVASNMAVPTVTINSLTLTCTNPSGTLTASVTGGAGPFTYQWSTGANTPSITVTQGGPYFVTVTGSNGCNTVASRTVGSDAEAPTLSLNSLTLTCANPSGTLMVNVTGGSAPYSYRWSTNATASQITVNAGGPYSVTVTGANGCINTTSTNVTSDTAVPTVTVNSLTLSCTNPTGILSASVTGGSGTYTYQWNTGATTPAISVTAAGPYSVAVTGSNGCTGIALTTVGSNTAVPSATINSLTLTCANPSGTLTASVTGGVTPYTYRWNTNATTPSITVGSAGSYSVVVTGANGCSTSAVTTVSADAAQPNTSLNSLTLTCTNPTGTLVASVTNGVAPFTYRWSTGETSAAISVSAAIPYSVTVTGANGCFGVETTTVRSDTAVPVATINSLTLSCANPSGTLSVSITGGAAPYAYRWNTNATSSTISVSTAGPYSVTITGSNGCSTVVTTTVGSNTAAPTVSVNSLTLTCANPTGTLTAAVTGGAGPFTYQWTNTATTPTVSVSTAGTYSVTVTGANGCSTTVATTVTSDTAVPTVFVNSLTLTCTNPSGTLSVNVSGGITPYSYQWNNGATTPAIPVTAGGTYIVTVTGSNGCFGVASTTVVSSKAAPVASINSLTLSCANPTGTLSASVTGGTTPYSYLWSTGANTPSIIVGTALPYSVTVTGSNGCSTVAATTVSSDTAVPTVTVNSLTLSCANSTGTLTANVTGGTTPYSYLWSTGANTPSILIGSAGSYSVTVTGSNGCSRSATTTVSADAGVPAVTLNSLTLTCTNPTGTVSTSVNGGSGPFTYLWNTGATTPAISISAAGPYSVTVTGSNGCSAVATTAVVSDTAVPTVSVNSLTLTCATPTGSLSALVTGGTGPFTYKWNTNSIVAVISVGSAGGYSVLVTGANGCSASAVTTVTAEVGQPNVSLNSLTLTCANPTGTLLATVTDGVAPFTYLWSTGATTQAISATTTILYSVTVTGSNGCIGVKRTRVNSDTVVPALTVNSLTVTCANPSGTLSASVGAGSGPFTYRWNTGSNSSVIIVSAAGPYSVTVTGSNGCSAVATTTVASDTVAPTLTVSASNTLITVGGSTTLTASCSTGGILTWSTGDADNGKTILIVSPQTTTPYSVTCTLPTGCTAVSSTTITVQSTASIGSFVFEDTNGNGQQDPGEPGINGVTITLLGGTTPLSTTTVNGLYSFVGLTPGVSYTVVFSTPQGYTFTIPNQGSDLTDSDADPATGSTGGYTLTPGQSNTTVNAGFYRPASLGDKVFADLNRDGLQTPGENGIPGVTITLIGNGTVVATTTSQPDGTYSFTGLTPGVPYSVSFTAPANNTVSPANQGPDDTVDSDIINGVTQSLTLSSGQNNTSVDAGFYPLRFDLALSKAIARAPVAAMPGDLIMYQLVLTNQGDILATNTQVTDKTPAGLTFNAINSPAFSLSGANAIATVASLAPGQSVTLTIAYNVIGFSSQPIINTAEITADSGDDFDSQPNDNDPNQDDTGSATIQTAQLASIGSFVFEDTNGNGQQDSGEPGINGVTVMLLGGPSPLSTTTVNGVYSFTGLTPGVSYTVVFSTPQGYTATIANQGSDVTDSDADPVTGRTTAYTLGSGDYNPTVNAGFYLIPKPCSLTITPIAGACTNATNGTVVTSVFSSTVTVTLTNSVTGTLSITDGDNTFTAAVTASTTAITAVFTELPSDGSNRTVTATLANCGSASAVYQAPVPCQPVPLNPLLSVQKTVSRSTAQIGDILTYTVVLTNSGSATATTTVRDSLSTGITYVAGSATAPAGTTFMAGQPVSLWTVPLIGIGQSLTLTFQVRVDSSGIVYNTATIPGSVARVCTSVPVRVCAGSQYEFRLTVAPGRSSYRWFRDGVEVTTQTTNVFTVTTPGSYSLAVDNVTGSCPDFTCCPFVVVEDTLPTLTARAIPATCSGTSVRANGQLVIANVNPAYRYQYSAGVTFNAAASVSGAPKPVPAGGVLVNNLTNPATASPFTIRVYNGSGCYTDQTVTVQPTVCNCPPDVCVPFVLKQTKRGH